MIPPQPNYKFIPIPGTLDTSPTLLVADYNWWHNNREEVESWMKENLSQGLQHLRGMIIKFDSDEDRVMFLLRFGL